MRELGFLLVVCAASGGEAAIVGTHSEGGSPAPAMRCDAVTKTKTLSGVRSLACRGEEQTA